MTPQADVLVNSANSNLKYPTACGYALIQVGGEQFNEACQRFTNINSGEIECTSGGNLSCKHVIHAVCGDWDGEGGDGEKVCCIYLCGNLKEMLRLKYVNC